jgi:hypothetical protein
VRYHTDHFWQPSNFVTGSMIISEYLLILSIFEADQILLLGSCSVSSHLTAIFPSGRARAKISLNYQCPGGRIGGDRSIFFSQITYQYKSPLFIARLIFLHVLQTF